MIDLIIQYVIQRLMEYLMQINNSLEIDLVQEIIKIHKPNYYNQII